MNEKLQYASMLEIPVSTCNITYKPSKKHHRKKQNTELEQLKTKVIDKVNQTEQSIEKEQGIEQIENVECAIPIDSSVTIKRKQTKKKFKLSFVGIGALVVCALIAVIMLTNALVPNSGLNAFFRSVFSSDTQNASIDNRIYSDFTLSVPASSRVSEGVISLEKGSIYPPCDGKITQIDKDSSGNYSVKIEHGENFSTKITGLTFCNFSQGENVYATIPVGFARTSIATMSFFDESNGLLACFTLSNGSVVWSV